VPGGLRPKNGLRLDVAAEPGPFCPGGFCRLNLVMIGCPAWSEWGLLWAAYGHDGQLANGNFCL